MDTACGERARPGKKILSHSEQLRGDSEQQTTFWARPRTCVADKTRTDYIVDTYCPACAMTKCTRTSWGPCGEPGRGMAGVGNDQEINSGSLRIGWSGVR